MTSEIFETFGAACMMLAALLFVSRYAMVRWEDTREGRNLMLMGFSLLLLGGAHITRIWWDAPKQHDVYDYVLGSVFLLIAYDLVQRDCLRQKLMRRRRKGQQQ